MPTGTAGSATRPSDTTRPMKAIAIIPARGGSVGLPGKNIKPLNGTPLVVRTIRAALGARSISGVFVSSDDVRILSEAQRAGATPVTRPEELSGSSASSESALLHVLGTLDASSRGDVVVFLQCTSPFTTSEDIDRVVSAIVDGCADSAFSAVDDHGFIWEVGSDGAARGITHDETKPRQRRQDMAPRYRENGAVYAMRTDGFIASGNRFFGHTKLVPVDAPPIEIDTPEDWAVAEAFAFATETHAAPELSGIRAVVMDFDGVHTDDRVLVGLDGSEFVTCSRSDGMGLELLRKAGFDLLILSKEQNPVVRARAAKLKIDVQHGLETKLANLEAWCRAKRLDLAEVAYVGNDINDLECLRAAGVSVAPADAHPAVLKEAAVVLNRNGGFGALRELADMLLNVRA